jgi:quinol monooxygenase YgiN
MVGGLKNVVVNEGKVQEFEALFRELRETMRQREPGCLLYSLLKSRTNPRAYIVHEQYRDQGRWMRTNHRSIAGCTFQRCVPSLKASPLNISMGLLNSRHVIIAWHWVGSPYLPTAMIVNESGSI